MASMGFSQATVTDLLVLVDENKTTMNEDTYIRMCNLLRHVHLVEQQNNRDIIVPEPLMQSVEKIKIDFRYRYYVHNSGMINNYDKLNVLNHLFNKTNTTYTRDYENNALHYISENELQKLYDEERTRRCRQDALYKKIIDDYTALLDIRPRLCFCE
jgi:hypothetical protein